MMDYVASWVTPTTLFCFMNLMIGTLFISANMKTDNKQQTAGDWEHNPPHQARAPSLLQRVRSLNFSPYSSGQKEPEYENNPAPSLLARVMPSNFYRNSSVQQEQEYEQNPAPSLLERVMPSTFYRNSPVQQGQEYEHNRNRSVQQEQEYEHNPAQEYEHNRNRSVQQEQEYEHNPVPSLLERVMPSTFYRNSSVQQEQEYEHNRNRSVQQEQEYEHNPDPSLLERVMPSTFYRNSSVQQEQEYEDNPAPSLLARVMPSTFYRKSSVQQEQEYEHNPAPSLLARVMPSNFYRKSSVQTNPGQPETHHANEAQGEARQEQQERVPEPARFLRIPPFVERVRAIKFSIYGSEQTESARESDPTRDQHVARSMSVTEGEVLAGPARLRRSASEKVREVREMRAEEVDIPRPATVRERKQTASGEDEAGVDAMADNFIDRFRQQLKLQRVDSILRFQEMLTRGSGPSGN